MKNTKKRPLTSGLFYYLNPVLLTPDTSQDRVVPWGFVAVLFTPETKHLSMVTPLAMSILLAVPDTSSRERFDCM